jgi:hypothetical protein
LAGNDIGQKGNGLADCRAGQDHQFDEIASADIFGGHFLLLKVEAVVCMNVQTNQTIVSEAAAPSGQRF